MLWILNLNFPINLWRCGWCGDSFLKPACDLYSGCLSSSLQATSLLSLLPRISQHWRFCNLEGCTTKRLPLENAWNDPSSFNQTFKHKKMVNSVAWNWAGEEEMLVVVATEARQNFCHYSWVPSAEIVSRVIHSWSDDPVFAWGWDLATVQYCARCHD